MAVTLLRSIRGSTNLTMSLAHPTLNTVQANSEWGLHPSLIHNIFSTNRRIITIQALWVGHNTTLVTSRTRRGSFNQAILWLLSLPDPLSVTGMLYTAKHLVEGKVEWIVHIVSVTNRHSFRHNTHTLPESRRRPSDGSLSAIPRGPPRKPKQSGFAMWVGNLPPGARVEDLKDHFSRDATRDIESLFLISKSNCAFVNYRTEAACTAAMQRFHDSRFQGVRLVCRLRRSSAAAASGVPTAPSSMSGRRISTASSSKSPAIEPPDDTSAEVEQAVEDHEAQDSDTPEKVTEKFFIVKSLTLQDLEQSVINGIWATQSHNEEVLNKAFQVCFISNFPST
jgi:hypothetical protein